MGFTGCTGVIGGDFSPRSSPLTTGVGASQVGILTATGVIAAGFIAFPKSPVTIFSMRSLLVIRFLRLRRGCWRRWCFLRRSKCHSGRLHSFMHFVVLDWRHVRCFQAISCPRHRPSITSSVLVVAAEAEALAAGLESSREAYSPRRICQSRLLGPSASGLRLSESSPEACNRSPSPQPG